MRLRMAWRALFTSPGRAAVLACGFGFGIAVMAELLGVGQVILEQAHAPALQGGGDVIVSGAMGSVDNGRFVLSTLLHRASGGQASGPEIVAASPSKGARLVLVTPKGRI